MKRYKVKGYPYALSSDVPWVVDSDEWFMFMGTLFNVRAAKALCRENTFPIKVLEVEQLRDWVGGPFSPIIIKEERIGSADLSIPVIVASLKTSLLPIDGWHRIAKALRVGFEVPCIVLNKKQTREIMQ